MDTVVWDTMDTVLVLAMVDTMAATDWSMARGLLMLSPRLMLIPTFCIVVWDTMDTVVWDTMDTVLVLAMVDTMAATDWSTARGLLMLSPRLMLIPTFSMEDMEDMEDITDLAMPVMVDMGLDTEDTTGDKSSHCHTCSLLNDNHISIGK